MPNYYEPKTKQYFSPYADIPSTAYTRKWFTATDDTSPTAGILTYELNQLMTKARLSLKQRSMLRLYTSGFDTAEISRIHQTPFTTAELELNRILRKLERQPHLGLTTCLIEAFGFIQK